MELEEYCGGRKFENGRPHRSSIIAQQKKEAMIKALKAGKDSDYLDVRVFPVKGRGIVVMKQFFKGDFVLEYSGELIEHRIAKIREEEYDRKDIGSFMYFFKYNDKRYCIDATYYHPRLGRLVNHSCVSSNLITRIIVVDGLPRLVFIACRNICLEEELLYDYGDRRKEVLAQNTWLSNGNNEYQDINTSSFCNLFNAVF